MIEVTCVTLDSYVSEDSWPVLIKMDIEGSEVKALAGAIHLLSSPRAPAWLIAAHSGALDEQVRDILCQTGYEFGDFQHMIRLMWNSM
jgi:hypothetical protein